MAICYNFKHSIIASWPVAAKSPVNPLAFYASIDSQSFSGVTKINSSAWGNEETKWDKAFLV